MISEEIKPKKGRWARKKARQAKNTVKEDSFRKTGRLRLQAMLEAGLGTKRSKDKVQGTTKDKINSKGTFVTYKNQFRYFGNWLESTHPEAKTFEQALEYVDEYLTYLIEETNKSADSIATAKSSLAKIFGVPGTQFIATPPRERANIKRSRGEAKRDKHISDKKEKELALFTSAIGLRRAEMTKIEAEDLFFENGKPMLHVDKGTKGGKIRKVEIVGKTEEETKFIVQWIQERRGRLFPRLSSNYDNHYYRAQYAMRVYRKYARDVNKLKWKEKYIMRKDRAGEAYDKAAMLIASRNLGHNRISVIARSYLYQ